MGFVSTSKSYPQNNQETKQETYRGKEALCKSLASFSISASLQRASSTHHVPKKQQGQGPTPARVATLDVGRSKTAEHLELVASQSKEEDGKGDLESSAPKFSDERWKKGNWDLNMLVKSGRMDWDGVIVAVVEARRRKFLEMNPEAATNQEPVLFRSSIIPWWAWLLRSYLPEAELLNGRAAMVGFFTAYAVDALTRLDVVGQTGNFVSKIALVVTVVSVIIFRRSHDFGKLEGFADEATLYDRQ